MLVAEDEFVSRRVLQHALREYGTVHVAETGAAAVVAVVDAIKEQKPYDLICLDVMMPEMDGHRALAKIRALERSAKPALRPAAIIMTTGLSDPDTVREAIVAGCDGYLVKPIDTDALLEQLRRLALIR